MRILAPAALSLLVLGALACSGRLRKDEPAMTDGKQAMTDEALIARVRSAIDARVAPREIDAYVGQKAMVNTATGFPLEGLRRVNVLPDPDHPEHTLQLDSAEAVVYFGRPVESNDPKIVGVQYRRDGSAGVFFGIVLPP
jgi:hypothetical protein